MSTFKWIADLHHSEVMFKVKHLMISTVTGNFKRFSVQAETEDEKYSKFSAIVFEADVNSLSTNNETRDEHLKSAEFFDAVKYQKIIFMAPEFNDFNSNKLVGNLTIKGITKTIELNVELNGIATDMYGQTKAGFSLHGVISRKEFGLTWNHLTESGSVVVSDEVRFQAEIQLIRATLMEEALQNKMLADAAQ